MNLDRLLKLRLLVARFGEMDSARWWNTRGVLGRLGETALKRGFAQTHFFVQARLVFAVAANRCRAIFDPPRAMTLWNLPAEIEDRFDSQWPMLVRARRFVVFLLRGDSGPRERQPPGRGKSPRARGRSDSSGRPAAPTLRGESRCADPRRSPAERPDPHPARAGFLSRRARHARDPLRAAGRLTAMRRARSMEISTFTIVKGSLIPETYAAFRAWDLRGQRRRKLRTIPEGQRRSAPGAPTGYAT